MSTNIKTVYIYALVDPSNNKPFYVGKANRPQARFSGHMSMKDKNRHKVNKIKKIIRNGGVPQLRILEECKDGNWKQREKHWIAYGRENGWPLTNIVNGGEGATWDYMRQVAAPYLNPTREDFVGAINDIIHPANHKAVSGLSYGWLVKLGQKIASHLIST